MKTDTQTKEGSANSNQESGQEQQIVSPLRFAETDFGFEWGGTRPMKHESNNKSPSRCLARLVSGFFVTTRLDGIGLAVEFYRTENNDEWTRHYAGGDVTYSASITIIRWVFGYELSR